MHNIPGGDVMALPKIKMERPSVYNGLDWLIALDEGLFAKEGLEVELIAHGEPGAPIPEDQLLRTYQWMVSWNLIDAGHEVQDFVNTDVMPRV